MPHVYSHMYCVYLVVPKVLCVVNIPPIFICQIGTIDDQLQELIWLFEVTQFPNITPNTTSESLNIFSGRQVEYFFAIGFVVITDPSRYSLLGI